MNELEIQEAQTRSEMVGVKEVLICRRSNLHHPVSDYVAQEQPVALVYNGISHVVMMATPKELDLFAIGFSLTEGIIQSIKDIYGLDIYYHATGIEIHIELSSRRFAELKEKRRAMAGRTGCGICGVEQLNEVVKPLPQLPFTQKFDINLIDKALPQLRESQKIGQLTGCTHAAGWVNSSGDLLAGCEDIGRHIALDKLLGLRAKQQWQNGAILVSSRASFEMVQKAAMCGAEILFVASAATTLAINVAQQCNLTLIGFTKPGQSIVYTHEERVI